MRDDLFECGGRERVYRLQERRTSCFKSNTPKSCTWSRVKVPPRVSGKESRGSQSGSRCSWACAASGTRSLQSSAARQFHPAPTGPPGFSLTESPLGERTVAHICLVPGVRPRAALPTPRAFRPSGPAQCSRARSESGAGPVRAQARTRARTPALRGGGGGQGGRHGERRRRRRRRPHRLRRGWSSPSRVPSAAPEPREGETLSPGMQREEGFNTKMADGPDEYDTEAGCVPLLHPEVRNRTKRILRPSGPDLSAPPDLRRAGA